VREHAGYALIAPAMDPAAHINDPVRSLIMGLPLNLEFRTKGQLAIDIATKALAAGILLRTSSAETRRTAVAPRCESSPEAAARPVSLDVALGDIAVEQVHAGGVALFADLGEQPLDRHGRVLGAAGTQVIMVDIHQRRPVLGRGSSARARRRGVA